MVAFNAHASTSKAATGSENTLGTKGCSQESPVNPSWARLALRMQKPDVGAARQVKEQPDAQSGARGGLDPTASTFEFATHMGPGEPLDPASRAYFEPRFAFGFGNVRIHSGTQADAAAASIHARAFTRGSDVVFAAGELDPQSDRGRRLLAHELTHVVQQSRTSGHAASQTMAVGPLDNPAEREAESVAHRVARGLPAGPVTAAPSAIQRKGAEPGPQAKPAQTLVPYLIVITKPMTAEQFKVVAMTQVFGGPVENLKWQLTETSYDPKDSPIPLGVELSLLHKHRARSNQAKGIDIDEIGGVVGAEERAKEFQGAQAGPDKEALIAEIDRRFSAATGSSELIKKGEKGKADLWKSIRDEVLFQHEYIANLPPNVKSLIKMSITGKDLTPADYDRLFRIAKKIEAMPAGQVADYASKVTGTTTDLGAFETSLDQYSGEVAQRKKTSEAHNEIMTKLDGLQAVYLSFRLWQLGITEKTALEKQLQASDFAGIFEFEAYIEKFLKGFETESAKFVTGLLAKYAGRMYREAERYKDQKEVAALHARLGGVRTQFAIFEQQQQIMQEEWAKQAGQREIARTPGSGHVQPKPTERFREAETKTLAAKSAVMAEIKSLEHDHPIFQNDDTLPPERRIDKAALAKADENSLQGVLLGYIAQRQTAIKDAKDELLGNTELIYKMDAMMPQFYQAQGIAPGSVHDLIIKNKLRDDRIKKIVIGILGAIAAIALTVVSLGTATPALVAAGAAAGAFGLSAYQAYEEYKEYTENQKLAGVGLVDDPSIVWLVVAVAGAALDMGAAVKAVRALEPAAKALNAALEPAAKALNVGEDLAKFNKAVHALELASEIEAKVARAAEKAAAARTSYAEASNELSKVLRSRTYSFPGPFTDPDVYKQLVKMAAAKFEEIGNNGIVFIEEIRKARTLSKLGEMTPEELAKVKQAWAEGKALADAAKGSAMFNDAVSQFKNTALTKAGRALSKHPEVIGQTKDTLRKVLRTDPALNEAAANALKDIMSNGIRFESNLPRYGQTVIYQIPGGFGARFEAATNQFIGFINP